MPGTQTSNPTKQSSRSSKITPSAAITLHRLSLIQFVRQCCEYCTFEFHYGNVNNVFKRELPSSGRDRPKCSSKSYCFSFILMLIRVELATLLLCLLLRLNNQWKYPKLCRRSTNSFQILTRAVTEHAIILTENHLCNEITDCLCAT